MMMQMRSRLAGQLQREGRSALVSLQATDVTAVSAAGGAVASLSAATSSCRSYMQRGRIFSSSSSYAADSSVGGSPAAPLSPPAASAAAEGSNSKGKKEAKILVLGGSGFVGSAVCKEAVSRGIPVQSLSRSGAPGAGGASWVNDVDWVRGDVFDVHPWRHHLKEASAVVSCIGAFGSNDFMRRINGEANANAARTAAEEGVERFVYVSAHDVGLPSFVLRGYYEGKAMAERAVMEEFPTGGFILRPGMIHGARRVGSITIPLSAVGAPLELILTKASFLSKLPIVGKALVPPVRVEDVARVSVSAALDEGVSAGITDVWGIIELSHSHNK